MTVGLQVFVGVVAGVVMLGRVAVAACQAWLDGEIVARRARREDDRPDRRRVVPQVGPVVLGSSADRREPPRADR